MSVLGVTGQLAPVLDTGRATAAAMQSNRLESSILKQGQSAGARSAQFDGALDKLAGEIRQAQQTIDFARQLNQDVGAMAIAFGLVQVMRDFHDHRNLRAKARARRMSSREMPVPSRRSSTPNMPSTRHRHPIAAQPATAGLGSER
jgi:hypothetical protein